MEYVLRFYSVVEATDVDGKPLYTGLGGRLRWAVTDFYSWIDLASIVPFYVDIMVASDLPATQFIRSVSYKCFSESYSGVEVEYNTTCPALESVSHLYFLHDVDAGASLRNYW